ncbi:MAG: leucine-rich repeat domain-containing protein, partial [Nitrospirae bacterium]|nr:leucine-rich repeat domain-containing protein [Nitrospirota bacterium]
MKELPASMGRLSSLRRLNLRGNQLTQITASWEGMANLEFLDVAWNRLTEFPVQLRGKRKLK